MIPPRPPLTRRTGGAQKAGVNARTKLGWRQHELLSGFHWGGGSLFGASQAFIQFHLWSVNGLQCVIWLSGKGQFIELVISNPPSEYLWGLFTTIGCFLRLWVTTTHRSRAFPEPFWKSTTGCLESKWPRQEMMWTVRPWRSRSASSIMSSIAPESTLLLKNSSR